MKRLYFLTPKTLTVILSIVLLFYINQITAGDIGISFRYCLQIAMEDREQPILAEVNNVENFSVDGASLNFSITNKLSLEVAYQWSTDIGSVQPQSSVLLKAPEPWIPMQPGQYSVHYELNSLNDINPTNDTASFDLEVLPSVGLSFGFNQFNFVHPFQLENSNTGRVDVNIPPGEEDRFLNMMFAIPNSSSISPQWLVQNFPIPAFPDTQEISYWIDLEQLGVENGMEIPYLRYDFQIGSSLVLEPFFSTQMYITNVYKDDYIVAGDNPVEWEFGAYLEAPPINWGGEFMIKTWNYRGCNVPNIDLDSSKYNPRDMAGEVGDWNSCSPAAATNSLQWLENNDPNIPDTELSHREKLKLFNKLSGRANEDGSNTGNTIKGKLAYIDSLKLPIHVKWQGIPYDTAITSPNAKFNHAAESKNDSVGAYPTFDWLASEIEKGEDVEVKFGWYDTTNVRHGGHWVVVSGVSDVTTAQGLYIKDDEDQAKEGGTRQTYVNWVTNENGRPRLVGFKGANNRCWVESVVSESYDSTITFGPEGGDISITPEYQLQVAMAGVKQPIIAAIQNIEMLFVNGVTLNFKITDKISNEIVYEWSADIDTIQSKDTVMLTAPEPWIPANAGQFQLHYELSSENDTNTSNDTATFDLEVLPQPDLWFGFTQLSFINPFEQDNSGTGRLDVKIPPGDTDRFLNMMITLPGSHSVPPQWLVQNFPIPAFPDTQEISYWIDMEGIGVIDGMEVPYLMYDYQLGTSLVTQAFTSTNMFLTGVEKDEYDVGGDNPVDEDLGGFGEAPEIDWGGEFEVKTWNYRGCNVPNIDLDSSKYNPRDMEGEVGDWNSCGPASAVNSLQWLEDNNDKIPDSETSLRDKLKIFNEVSSRENENGLNTAGVIMGKLAIIDSLKLPIHVKWQGIPTTKDSIKSPNEKYKHVARGKNDSVGAYATFEWLASEIEAGEDVEVKFGWYDTLDVRHGGHWVVVSGVSDVTTARGIYVKDDQKQGKEGGTRQTYVNWVTNENGRPRLVGFKGANNRCWVESVVSESYDSTITFDLTYSGELRTKNEFHLTVYENPSSKLKPVNFGFDLHSPGEVHITVYEISGRLVHSRKIYFANGGHKNVQWDGKEINGLFSSSGTYFVRVSSGTKTSTKKFVRQD